MSTIVRTARVRVRVFVDYWNFQLTLDEKIARSLRDSPRHARFAIDWGNLGPWLARKACSLASIALSPAEYSFEGVHIYTSFNPATAEGVRFRTWTVKWLNRQPGVVATCLERKPRSLPRCPSCRRSIAQCPHQDCKRQIVSTIEKGVDTLLATDMIRLAWEEAYDLAVLASTDSDLVPAVQFLGMKGRKVVQAGFPPVGSELATSCWASFDVFPDCAEIERCKS